MRAALVSLAALALASAARANPPQIDYMLECQGCHMADGSGSPGAVPPLTGVGRFLAVEGGREYLVQVPGSAQSALSDAELAAVLTWMVRRFGPPEIAAAFAPFGAAEVGRLRSAAPRDAARARRELIGRMAPAGDVVP